MDFKRILSANVPWLLQAAAALLICVTVSGAAMAQKLERENTVADRARPGLDADGIPLGGFRLFPEVGLGVFHKDNIFATKELEQSDWATVLQPELTLVSESSRHRAAIGARGDIARYNDFDNEDYDDFDIYAKGGFDIGNGRLEAELRHSDQHEDRTSVDDARGVEPTRFTVDEIDGAYTWKPGRWITRVDGGYREFEFDDTATLTTPINNSDRDRSVGEIGFRLGREMSPAYALYGEVRGKQIEYDQQFDNDGFERSSDGFRAVAGALLDFSGQTFGEVFVGYMNQEYDDPRFGEQDGPTFGGKITWNITRLTTLIFSGDRRIDSTTIVGAAGIDTTEFGFQADHELLRSLVLSLDITLANEDFNGIDRDDDLTRIMVGGKYFMNRYLNLEFGYIYRDRDTSPKNSGGRDFEVSQILVLLTGQL